MGGGNAVVGGCGHPKPAGWVRYSCGESKRGKLLDSYIKAYLNVGVVVTAITPTPGVDIASKSVYNV